MKSFLRRKLFQAITALVMAIAALTTLVGLGVITGIAGAAPPGNSGFLTVPLTLDNRNCDFSLATNPLQGTGTGTGFVNFKVTESGKKLFANVTLQGAAPNATYTIRLIETPSAIGCAVPLDQRPTLITDAQGNGEGHIQIELPNGTLPADAWVDLNNLADPGADFYTSKEVCGSSTGLAVC